MVTAIDRSALQIRPIDWCGLHRNYLNDGEMEILVALVRSVEPRTMIEIGCRDGRTARVLLRNVQSLERYIGIDVTDDYQPGLPHQRSEMVEQPGHYATSDPLFELLIRPRGSLDLTELEPCDAVFIDGDHSSKVVTHDSVLAHAAIRDPGIIVWHDYHSIYLHDVSEALDNLNWPIQHVAGTWLAFLRTANGTM